jgi:uncharacterized protein YpmS
MNKTMKTQMRFLMLIAAIALAIGACNFPFWGSPGPTEEPVHVSTQEVLSLKENLENSQATLESSGDVTLTFTEAQLTSIVSNQLADQPEAPLEDVQIRLRDGQVLVSGQVKQGDIYLPLDAVIKLSASNGDLDYEIVSAKVGVFPLPDSVIEQFTTQIDDAFAAKIKSETSDMYIDTVSVQNGEIVVEGHQR